MKHKALVLFTDGEDHEGGMESVLEEVKKSGVRIYCIGLGTEKGDPIPLTDESGKRSGFKKDREGQIVITKLNPALLEEIAASSGGLYLPSTPAEREIDLIMKHMEGMGKRQFQERMIREKEDHFQLFLLWAVVFLVFEMLVRRTKPGVLRPLSLILIFLLFSGFLKGPKKLTDEGNELFEDKRYQSAIERYREAQVKEPDDPTIRYNLGTALYQTEEYQSASQELEKAVEVVKDPQLSARVLYNYGNAQYRLGNFEKAIESYEKVLELDPKDEDAKYNLEFLMKQKSMFEKKDQDRKQESQQQQKQIPQQQDQQEQQQQQQQQQDEQQQQQQQEQEQEQQKQSSEGQEQEEDQPSPTPQGEDEESKAQPEQGEKEQPESPQQPERGRFDEGNEEQEQPRDGQEYEQAPKPLQGQMTMENALRILDALREGERELQDLRRPPVDRRQQAEVLKDW